MPTQDITRVPVTRILSIEPYWRGFGFAVMEGPDQIIEWGVKEIREEKHLKMLKMISRLMTFYDPDFVVIEDLKHNNRRPNMRDGMAAIIELARSEGYKVEMIGRQELKRTFSPKKKWNKSQLIQMVATRFRELSAWQPPPRKSWETENSKTHIFTAVANALACYKRQEAKD